MKSTYEEEQEEQQKPIIIQQFIKSLNKCSINSGQKLKKKGYQFWKDSKYRNSCQIFISIKTLQSGGFFLLLSLTHNVFQKLSQLHIKKTLSSSPLWKKCFYVKAINGIYTFDFVLLIYHKELVLHLV
jgi:hypothetical protein